MANVDLLDDRSGTGLDSLYWWRRAAPEDASLTGTVVPLRRPTLVADAANDDAIEIADLPGNQLRARAAQLREVPVAQVPLAIDPTASELLAALRREKRNAIFAVATGGVATAAPAAAAVYAAVVHRPTAFGFAVAGVAAASFALINAVRWLVLLRNSKLPFLLKE